MQINLQGRNLELTEAIRDYVEKRVTNLGKLLTNLEKDGRGVMVNFEVIKTTNHHKSGEIFRATCEVNIHGKRFYSEGTAEDMYAAIDEVKDTLFNEIEKSKDRKQTLFRRGASSVKKMLKGLSKRNPFTSKY